MSDSLPQPAESPRGAGAVIVGGDFHGLMAPADWTANVLPDMTGRVCLITGATSGIGRAAAYALAALNANLILVARRERIGAEIVRSLRHRFSGPHYEFIRADLSALSDVRALAAAVTRNYTRLDVALNNAGARFDRYYETGDGLELTFATNHLGHFLLMHLLLERLVRTPAARVITVASGSHYGVAADGDWYLTKANYDRRVAYGKSKLANIVFAYELAERLKNTAVTSNAVDPGGVASNFARNNGSVSWLRHLAGEALAGRLTSPRAGAETLVYLAVSEEVHGVTGKYFHRSCPAESSSASHSREAAQRLWEVSLRLTGLRADTTAAALSLACEKS